MGNQQATSNEYKKITQILGKRGSGMKCQQCGKFCAELFIIEQYDYYSSVAIQPKESILVCKKCKESEVADNG